MAKQVLIKKAVRERVVSLYRAGISISGCAHVIGISQQALSQYINNHPSFKRQLDKALTDEIDKKANKLMAKLEKDQTAPETLMNWLNKATKGGLSTPVEAPAAGKVNFVQLVINAQKEAPKQIEAKSQEVLTGGD